MAISLTANASAARFYGYSQEQLKSMKIGDLNTLSPEEIRVKMGEVEKERQSYFFFKHRLFTGEIRDVEVYSSPVEIGGRTMLHSIVHDITDRLKAEEDLRYALAYNRSLIEASLDPLITIGSSGQITDVNTATERITGFSREELIGTDFSDYFTEPERARESYKQVFREQKVLDYPLEIRHKDGQIISVLYNAAVFHNTDGKVIGVFAAARDITARNRAELALKESEGRLRELNATKDKFFSIIAHDLKSPFNSILGFSNLLAKRIQEKDYEGIEKYTEIIQDSAQRSMDLLMNLLEWSRSQTGRIEYNPEHIEIVALINEVIKFAEDSARQKSISINKELPHNASVYADRAMINTILRNLISNAVKFTRPGGTITISVEQTQFETVISVCDNGIGIEKNSIAKLFRIDTSYSTLGTQKEQGTGLGLILCKEFIDKTRREDLGGKQSREWK